METLQPTHDVLLGDPSAGGVGQMFFGAGERLYVEAQAKVINLWDVAVFHWPELLGAIVGIVTLAILLWGIRVLRRPRAKGKIYCRRCNYDLGGLPEGGVCSECGTDPKKRRPIPGRSVWIRLLPTVTAAIVVIGGYSAIFAAGVGRKNAWSGKFDLSSMEAAEFAARKKVAWLEQHAVLTRGLFEVDLKTGRIVRRVCTVGTSLSRSDFRFRTGPDGDTVIVRQDLGTLAAVELRTGRILRTLGRLDRGLGTSGEFRREFWCHIAGWTDRATAYVQWFDPVANRNEVYRWSLAAQSGSPEELVKVSDLPAPPNPRLLSDTMSGPVLLYLVPGSKEPLGLEVPGHSYSVGYFKLKVRDLAKGGEVLRTLVPPARPGPGAEPVFLPDGSGIFYASDGECAIWFVSLTETEESDRLRVGKLGWFGAPGLSLDAKSGWLFFPDDTMEFIRTFDTTNLRWRAALSLRGSGLLFSSVDPIVVSPDGRWVACGVPKNSPRLPPTGFSTVVPMQDRWLQIFDLSKLAKRPTSSPSDTPHPPSPSSPHS